MIRIQRHCATGYGTVTIYEKHADMWRAQKGRKDFTVQLEHINRQWFQFFTLWKSRAFLAGAGFPNLICTALNKSFEATRRNKI